MIGAAFAVRLVSRPDASGLNGRSCALCGYLLVGLRVEQAKCPECGTPWTALPDVAEAMARKRVTIVWLMVFGGGVLAHAPGIVGCALKTTYWDPLYSVLVVVLVIHAAVSATASAIVSQRGVRWLTAVSMLTLTVGVFGLEAWLVTNGLMYPPTNRIDLQYEDLSFWSIPVFAAMAVSAAFVVGGVVVAVYLWFRGPELTITHRLPSPCHPFQGVDGRRD